MQFHKLDLAGAYLITPERRGDDRGYFVRTFCEAEFAAHGLQTRFVQHSASVSARKGTLRGLHFQSDPHGEIKIVRCLRGAIADVIVDLRPQSATFCGWRSFELTAENGRQLYIPKGFAHGFQTLTSDAEVGYLISEPYTPAAASGVRYNDPAFGIEWPLPVAAISARDLDWPDFRR